MFAIASIPGLQQYFQNTLILGSSEILPTATFRLILTQIDWSENYLQVQTSPMSLSEDNPSFCFPAKYFKHRSSQLSYNRLATTSCFSLINPSGIHYITRPFSSFTYFFLWHLENSYLILSDLVTLQQLSYQYFQNAFLLDGSSEILTTATFTIRGCS